MWKHGGSLTVGRSLAAPCLRWVLRAIPASVREGCTCKTEDGEKLRWRNQMLRPRLRNMTSYWSASPPRWSMRLMTFWAYDGAREPVGE